MIRFSAALVALALGVLAAGAATSRLLLVYVAIGGSALALVCLGLGVVLKRGELFGESSRGAGLSDRGRALAGFAADGFSQADRAPAFAEPRDSRSSAPGHRGQHAFGKSGQSGASPDDRTRVPAAHGRPPADRPEHDRQEPVREAWNRGRRTESAGQRVGPQPEVAAELRVPEWTPTPSWQPRPTMTPTPGMPPGGPPPADMRSPGAPSVNRPQRPAQFSGENPAAPSFGTQGPDASRPRHEAPGSSRPEPSRGEQSRPEPSRGEPSRPQGPGQQAPWSQTPRPEQPAAFWGGAPSSSASRSGDIPPPVEPIYPVGKSPAPAPAGERPEKAPEPVEEPLGWFYRAPEPEAERPADEKPAAAADQGKAAGQPTAEAATGSPGEERKSDSGAPASATVHAGAGETGEKTDRAEPGAAANADSGDRPGAALPNGDGPSDLEVTIVPGVPRYHRPGCSTIRFMDEGDLEKRSLQSAAAAGCAPCQACQPEAAGPAPTVG